MADEVPAVKGQAVAEVPAYVFKELKAESSLYHLWLKDNNDYADDRRYMDEHRPRDKELSAFVVISKPRDGGNMLKSEHMLKMIEKFDKALTTPVYLHNNTYTFEDACFQVIDPYKFQCFRYSVVDCFTEGDYDFVDRFTYAWQDMITSYITDSIHTMIAELRVTMVMIGLAFSGQPCSTKCSFDLLPMNTGEEPPWDTNPDGTWKESADCHDCLNTLMASFPQGIKDTIYYEVMINMWSGLQPGVTPEDLMVAHKVKDKFPNMTDFDRKRKAIDIAWFDLIFTGAKNQLGYLKTNPYNSTLNFTEAICDPKEGKKEKCCGPRVSLKGLSEDQVLKRVSKDCCMWDGGVQIPPINKYLLVGKSDPPITDVIAGWNTDFHQVGALESIVPLAMPTVIHDRVRSKDRPAEIGGPLDITQEQAMDVFLEMKRVFEKEFLKGWDDANEPVMTVALVDDTGGDGSISNTLKDATLKAFMMALPFFISIVSLSAFFFVDFIDPGVQSRALLGFFGAFSVVLGMFASIGIGALFDIKISMASAYTMPFILVGILCDDMYMLIMSLDMVPRNQSPGLQWAAAMRRVGLPITVTSAINFGVFLMTYISSDLPAIYDMGKMGMIATLTMYLVLMFSFSFVVYLDLVRRSDQRYDCCCCCCKRRGRPMIHCGNPTGQETMEPGPNRLQVLHKRVYKPMIRSEMGRRVWIGIAVVFLGSSLLGLASMKLGVDFKDLFPEDGALFEFFKSQAEYFPVWSITVNWGRLDYTDPMIQMKMVKQYEQVVDTEYIVPGIKSNTLWVSGLALWGLKDTTISNPKTAMCKSTWIENSWNLRLNTIYVDHLDEYVDWTGICRRYVYNDYKTPRSTQWKMDNWNLGFNGSNTTAYDLDLNNTGCHGPMGCCPVVTNLTETQFADCIGLWCDEEKAKCNDAFPGMKTGVSQNTGLANTPLVPIMISQGGGLQLNAHGLWENKDYVKLLQQTREFTDDDKTIHSWMSGMPYQYWEQYLTIADYTRIIGGISCGAGFVMSFGFLFLELTINKYGTFCQRLKSVFIGALLVAIVQALSMACVAGLCFHSGVELSAFTALSILLASGFAIEYAVHVVHHFLESQEEHPIDRLLHTMDLLFAPTAMSVISSGVSVIPLAFTGFNFVTKYFFMPLLFVVLVTYFYAIIVLPIVLSMFRCMPRLKNPKTIELENSQDLPPGWECYQDDKDGRITFFNNGTGEKTTTKPGTENAQEKCAREVMEKVRNRDQWKVAEPEDVCLYSA